MSLQDIIVTHHEEIIARWGREAKGGLAPSSLRHLELVEDLPRLLDELGHAVGEVRNSDSAPDACGNVSHGALRLRLHFDIAAVIHEFELLLLSILAVAQDNHVVPSLAEYERLFRCLSMSLVSAATEYVAQRDAESQRQATEHFAFIAHELRNPLGAVRLAVEMLRLRGELPATPPVFAMERSLARMGDLIEHSLQIATSGSTLPLSRSRFDLKVLLREVVEEAALHARERSLVLSLKEDGPLEMVADPRFIESAVTNLVRNAVKYSKEGGTVEVRAGEDYDARLAEIGAPEEQAHVMTTEVEDSCGGLPPGAAEKVFAPFVQLATGKGGFGLGLAIARQAAEAHGGMITVRNLPGKGCIFALVIPRGM